MTTTYRTEGRLTNPVTDLEAARAYLNIEGGMAQYLCWADQIDLKEAVHSVTWDLAADSHWFVVVVANQDLDADQLTRLSQWISGQNSDGLGEGFEQQPFAEPEPEYDRYGNLEDDDEDYRMASFDWETNPCTLKVVIPAN